MINFKEIELDLCKKCAKVVAQDGGFFSRSYKLINDIAFNENNRVIQDDLRKLKRIFPDIILNRG